MRITNKSLKLLEYYLHNRKEQVRINNTLSDGVTLTTGVPRGTV